MDRGIVPVDKTMVGRRFGASADSYDRYAMAQHHIYTELERMMADRPRRCWERVLEIGCGTSGLSKYIDERHDTRHWTLNDLDSRMVEYGAFAPRSGIPPEYRLGDAESIDLGTGYDLIISASALQWMHDPERLVRQLWTKLRPGGLLLLSTFGPENLREVRRLTGRGLSYASMAEVSRWLHGLATLEVHEELYTLTLATPRDVLLHLKRTGVTATSDSVGFWTADKLRTFYDEYSQLYSTPEGVALSYHPIYMCAESSAVAP